MTSTTLEMPADFESIRVLGDWLRSTMNGLGIDSTDDSYIGAIELAVHELATNCIDHAEAQHILVSAAVTSDALTISVTDDGLVPFEQTEVATVPDEPQVRGYGLVIVETVAQSVEYQRTNSSNQWQLQFSLNS